MSQKVLSGWKRYNANSRNNYTEDCVKRSLTIAYGMDYDDVAHELNAIKRKLGYDYFNIKPVYSKFIREHGLVSYNQWDKLGLQMHCTVEEVCEKCPEGTYVLVVEMEGRSGTHMVTVLDGDFYDSWDCSKWKAFDIYEIREGKSEPDAEISKEAVRDAILDFIESYTKTLAKKMPYGEFVYGLIRHIDDGWKFHVTFMTDEETWKSCKCTFIAKLNPRLSEQDNISKLLAKIRVVIREWAYDLRKDIEDRKALKTAAIHPDYHGNRMYLMKLPEWARPHVTYIYDQREYYQDPDSEIELEMDALPGDPRGEQHPTVVFRSSSWATLRSDLEDYKKHFHRFNWDY